MAFPACPHAEVPAKDASAAAKLAAAAFPGAPRDARFAATFDAALSNALALPLAAVAAPEAEVAGSGAFRG